eukprot:scaffold9111_cov90-Skeletonema_dohrnii-CCMP3373.AAC.4
MGADIQSVGKQIVQPPSCRHGRSVDDKNLVVLRYRHLMAVNRLLKDNVKSIGWTAEHLLYLYQAPPIRVSYLKSDKRSSSNLPQFEAFGSLADGTHEAGQKFALSERYDTKRMEFLRR